MIISHLYVFGEMSVEVFCSLFDWVVCFSGIELCELLVHFADSSSVVSFAIITDGKVHHSWIRRISIVKMTQNSL